MNWCSSTVAVNSSQERCVGVVLFSGKAFAIIHISPLSTAAPLHDVWLRAGWSSRHRKPLKRSAAGDSKTGKIQDLARLSNTFGGSSWFIVLQDFDWNEWAQVSYNWSNSYHNILSTVDFMQWWHTPSRSRHRRGHYSSRFVRKIIRPCLSSVQIG